MAGPKKQEITRLLKGWQNGDPKMLEEVQPFIERTLRGIAHNKLHQEKHGSGLQTTELLNEAYIYFLGKKQADWKSRRHFYRTAGLVMRNILVDEARKRKAEKRSGDHAQANLDDLGSNSQADPNVILSIHEALDHIEKEDPLLVELIDLRFFIGYSIKETSEILRIPVIRANRMWKFAKVWLYDYLKKPNSGMLKKVNSNNVNDNR